MARLLYLSCLVAILSLSNISSTFSNVKNFKHVGTSLEAKRFKTYLKKHWPNTGNTHNQWLTKARTAIIENDKRTAINSYASALSLNGKDANAWLELSKLYLSTKPAKYNERYDFQRNATSSAYNAYLLFEDPKLKALALAQLAKTLAKRSYWRPALNAYKASLAYHQDAKVQTDFNSLRAEKGFRVIDYRVDSEAQNPRACIQFSEPLSREKIDFSKFISVNGKDPAGVVKEAKQICVDGLDHGKRYILKVKEGMPSIIWDEKILKTSELSIYVRDRKPAVRFSAQGYVLPKTGQNGLPVISINTDKINVSIYRVGDRAIHQTLKENYLSRQLRKYDIRQLKNNLGAKVWSGQLIVKSQLNKDVTSALPVNKVIKDIKPGLYVAYASPDKQVEDYNTVKATQWFIVSDLAITAMSGRNGLHTFIRSLSTADPLNNVTVRLIARNNEVLGTTKTDENGHAKFDAGLIKGEGATSPYLIVADRKEGDYAFLDITHSAFDLTDRGVSGRRTNSPLDAFVFAERGVYRTGEQVYLTGLLRDQTGKAVNKLPLTMKIIRPDGVMHKRLVWNDEGDGGRSYIFDVPGNAMSGTWKALVYADTKSASIGSTSFLVEDYTPQRMELKLSSNIETLEQGKDMTLSATGRYLYGAPAANLSMNGEILIRKKTSGFKGFTGYQFGAFDEKFLNINQSLSSLPTTSKEGKADITSPLPKIPNVSKALEAQVTIRLNETGGRSIAKQISFDLKPQKTLLGIKPLFGAGDLSENQTAEFDVVSISKEGTQNELKGLEWELLKVDTRYQWYSNNGSWRYETISYTRKVANGSLDTIADAPARISSAIKSGRYRLEISSKSADGPRSSVEFYAGWYASAKADTPDKIDIGLDKKSYKVGDKLSVKLSPKTKGKALVAVMDNGIIDMKTVNLNDTTGVVDFTVKENWGPGTYVTAMFYRPMDQKAKRMPRRSIGISWVKPDISDKKLSIKLDVPEKIRPNSKLTIPVKISGLKEGTEANIVVSAVDVGILNLTRYEAPDPKTWYYGQRQLGLEIRDYYGKLIDGMHATSGKIRSGGGAMGAFGSPTPTAVKPVSLYSGIVIVDKEGKANITFDIPAFDGTLKLMAVAWNANQIGNTEQELIVRDPIVATGTVPHFLVSGDTSGLQFSLDNVEGAEGEYKYALSSTGPVKLDKANTEKTFKLSQKEQRNFSIPLTATDMGPVKLSLNVTGPDNFSLKRDFNFKVQPAAPNVTRRLVSQLEPNKGKLTINKDVAEGLIPASVKVSVNVNSGLALDIPGLLLTLDRYPYGCAEQTTSRALPLLYLSSVAEKSGVAGLDGAKKRVEKAINRLLGMQSSNGSFGLWSSYGGDIWLTAYITDFLTRAKDKGYDVPQHSFELALDRLQNVVNFATDFKSGGEGLAYALYVLARNGRAGIGDLRYFADAKLKNFSTPLAKAQVGAALSMYGDKERSQTAYQSAIETLNTNLDKQYYRRDYGTNLRDGAAALTLISETKSSKAFAPKISDIIRRIKNDKQYTSTQEKAWLLLAANSIQHSEKELRFGVNGEQHSGAYKEVLGLTNLDQNNFTVTNLNDKKVEAVVTVTGDSFLPEPPIAKGFKISREFYTLAGKQVDLREVKQNDRFVVVIKVDEVEAKRGRLILEDRIPAGFVIENPKLVTGSNIKGLPWLKYNSRIEHSEFKDDRFVTAFDMSRGYRTNKPANLTAAYIIRAVSPGTYLHPATVIEDMYRPGRFARSTTRKVTITK